MATDRPRRRPAAASRAPHRDRARAALLVLVAVGSFVATALGPSTPAAAADGWGWPLEPPEVMHAFDPPDNPYGSGHRGVDLAGSVGQVVAAPSSGTVTFAGVIAGRGVVVVSHGTVRSTFEPVVAEVVVGGSVGAGDPLGTLQGFAHHCALPCLHWGVIEGETYLDPLDFVGTGPSRLLPWWDDYARVGAALPGGSEGPPAAAPPDWSSATFPPARSGVDRTEVPVTDGAASSRAEVPQTATPGIDGVSGPSTVPRTGTADGRPAASDQAAGGRAGPRPDADPDTGEGMVAAAVIAVAGGVLAGGVMLRLLRRRR